MDSNSGLSDSKVHLLISFNSFSFGLHHIVVKQRQGGLNFIFIPDLIVLSARTVCWGDSGTYPFPSGQWPQTCCHPRRPGQMQRLARALLKLSLCRRDPRDDKSSARNLAWVCDEVSRKAAVVAAGTQGCLPGQQRGLM